MKEEILAALKAATLDSFGELPPAAFEPILDSLATFVEDSDDPGSDLRGLGGILDDAAGKLR